MARDHLRSDVDATRTLCDLPINGPAWDLPLVDALIDARNPCRNCERIDASRPPPETPFVRTAPAPASYGARELSTTAHRVLGRRGPEAEAAHRWRSAEHAVRIYVRWAAENAQLGVAIGSTSDWERARDRVQVSRDPSSGGREHASAERFRNVALAIDVIFASSPFHRAVYELAIAGLLIEKPTRQGGRDLKGRFFEWIVLDHERVAEKISDRFGPTTAHDVTTIRRTNTLLVGERLLAAGELGEREDGRARESNSGMERWAANLRSNGGA